MEKKAVPAFQKYDYIMDVPICTYIYAIYSQIGNEIRKWEVTCNEFRFGFGELKEKEAVSGFSSRSSQKQTALRRQNR